MRVSLIMCVVPHMSCKPPHVHAWLFAKALEVVGWCVGGWGLGGVVVIQDGGAGLGGAWGCLPWGWPVESPC